MNTTTVPMAIGWLFCITASSSEPMPVQKPSLVADRQGGWDGQAAAKYLDDRMDL